MNLAKLTKKELLDIAAKKKITGRTKMTKAELIAAVEPFFAVAQTETAKIEAPGYTVEAPEAAAVKMPKKDEYPIPEYYNVDTLKFMPVDPSKEYAYWEISDYTLNKSKSELRLSHGGLFLKVYLKNENGVTEAASVSVERVGNWYFNIYGADAEMWSELGLVDSNGAFHAILKSNTVKMPADKVSDIVDEETWMTIGGPELEKLYELSGAGQRPESHISSAKLHKDIAQRMSTHIASSGTLKDK